MRAMKSLVGRTVVCSIHQPSTQVYALADRVVFMADGCIVDASAAPLQPDVNPADAYRTISVSCV